MDNGVLATKNPSTYLMERVIYETPGNSLAHGILRGGYDGPNYEVAKAATSPTIVDCNHANSDKHPEKQIEIMKTVMEYNNPQVKGYMVESYLHDGRQDYHE
ncbi:MAG: hypothetical protein H6767_05365 [Candidatus Peribacteria bacterium]|nr:MAG: hypothetical protein H6767_05365 [Candidatus Peribacteria bacterium]